MFDKTILGVICLTLSATAAEAALITGSTSGPDDSFSINMTFTNDPTSTSDVVSILLDGSTATAFPILWDSAGSATNPAGATSSFVGLDTQFLTINFADSPDGFNPGESFSLFGMDPDGDPTPAGVAIEQLIGVQALFTFRNNATWLGEFVDNPATGAGLVLQQVETPEPATLLLFGTALAGAAFKRRRTRLDL